MSTPTVNKNRKKSRWFKAGMVLGVLLLTGALALVAFPPVLTIPAPTGPHPVGFMETVLTDPSRPYRDATHQFAGRPLTLHIWYPAKNTQNLQPEPYMEKVLNEQVSRFMGFPSFLSSETPSHAFRDAPALGELLPVVVFNHGFGSFSKQNFAHFQELASQGFAVVSVGHPGDSLVSKTADGQPILLNVQNPAHGTMKKQEKDMSTTAGNLASLLEQQRNARDAGEHLKASQAMARLPQYRALETQILTWVRDTRFVMAHLQEVKGPVLDPTRVTVMGHSLGGVVAMHLAQQETPGLLGIVNLDAPWLEYASKAAPLTVPSLHLLSTRNVFQKHNLSMAGTLQPALHTSAAAHVLEIPETAHQNFTDMNYLPVLKWTPMLGKVDGLKMANLMNTSVLNFLNLLVQKKALGGPLLDQGTSAGIQQFLQGAKKGDQGD